MLLVCKQIIKQSVSSLGGFQNLNANWCGLRLGEKQGSLAAQHEEFGMVLFGTDGSIFWDGFIWD